MSKHMNTCCDDCGAISHESGYFLRKRKNEHETLDNLTQAHCVDCLRPYELLESEKGWKQRCFSCYKKLHGYLVHCLKCKEQILVFESTGKDFCKSCLLSFTGEEKVCEHCQKLFYTDPNSKVDKTKCYSCYLMDSGVRRRCTDCKTTIFVKESDLAWKKKCKDCYFSS